MQERFGSRRNVGKQKLKKTENIVLQFLSSRLYVWPFNRVLHHNLMKRSALIRPHLANTGPDTKKAINDIYR